MSYLDEFKNRIQEEKEAKIERYKQFMEDYVLTQFVNSLTGNAIINQRTLIDEGINKKEFINWLESEGFTTTISQGDIVIDIS